MRLQFDVVDVFTEHPFAGNQLAVVHGAAGLDAARCLAIAQEFNFSETTFPGLCADDGSSYPTRIFTPGAEIPFAGHPTLGTAWVLRRRGQLVGDEVTQMCAAGRIGVRFGDTSDDSGHVELSAQPRDLLGPLPDDVVVDLLADLGLSLTDLAGPVWLAGCGLTFVHLPVVESAVARATPSRRPLSAYAGRLADLGGTDDPVEGINLVHLSGAAGPLQVHARVFVPGLSVPEDPATGSAAAGLGMALVASEQLPDGGEYRIRQGAEMGRPSVLHGRVEVEARSAVRCHVGGQVHHVAHGEITVPS